MSHLPRSISKNKFSGKSFLRRHVYSNECKNEISVVLFAKSNRKTLNNLSKQNKRILILLRFAIEEPFIYLNF